MDLETMDTTARNASLQEVAELLETQKTAKHDVVAAASALECRGGTIRVRGSYQRLDLDGVSTGDALLTPTRLAEASVADKLRIPTDYLRRMRAENVELYDHNVNGWLRHQPERRFLMRGLVDSQGEGLLRAMLSDSFRIVDNLDVLLTALQGIEAAGAQVDIAQADLTESRMYVKVRSQAISALAPGLLRNYVSPFSRARGADNPLVFAGFVISNSEIGHGAFTLSPQITVEICDNGMTMTKYAEREVHLGGKLPAGVVRFAADTQNAALELVKKTTRDAVATFLSQDFLDARVAELTADAGVEIGDPAPVIEHVATALRFSQQARESILRRFTQGADMSSGGVLHAVTAAAQDMPDADEAYALEAAGVPAMQRAAAFARTH
ncbi:DUF932 domain-containing protein [Pseudonocardia sp. KRD291]|uniref:DUF932 domain-containing protein n=1 Tax=Pseudonocardia sp. KRD291 TaxID=2792007 RepID=UPI001C4A1BC8|nr:DUF932 domain-containing protein [Pseudonocardia sp. KRD291]MBW0101526.1 DUF932 domain-containing protein [Pseudonocardia sp. KRD291]